MLCISGLDSQEVEKDGKEMTREAIGCVVAGRKFRQFLKMKFHKLNGF